MNEGVQKFGQAKAKFAVGIETAFFLFSSKSVYF